MTDNFKKKTIYFLLSFAIFLMIANVIIDFINADEVEKTTHEISSQEIEDNFALCVDEFGIENSWLKAKTIQNKNLDSLKKVYYVQVPTDLNIPLFLKEIEYKLLNKPVEIISEEIKENGNTAIKIYSNKNLKFQAYLNYDDKISREKFKFAFLVDNYYDLSNSDMEELYEMQLQYGVGLIPSESNYLLYEQIKQYKKESYLIINDEASETKYELEPSTSKVRLKSSLISIVSDFSSTIFYMVDKSSELYSSTAYNFIRDELLKRKINLYSYENFIDLRNKEKNDIASLFKFYCEDTSRSKNIFLIDYSGLKALSKSIKEFQKKGNRLVNPSELLFTE